jgi:hypothetical protein
MPHTKHNTYTSPCIFVFVVTALTQPAYKMPFSPKLKCYLPKSYPVFRDGKGKRILNSAKFCGENFEPVPNIGGKTAGF